MRLEDAFTPLLLQLPRLKHIFLGLDFRRILEQPVCNAHLFHHNWLRILFPVLSCHKRRYETMRSEFFFFYLGHLFILLCDKVHVSLDDIFCHYVLGLISFRLECISTVHLGFPFFASRFKLIFLAIKLVEELVGIFGVNHSWSFAFRFLCIISIRVG